MSPTKLVSDDIAPDVVGALTQMLEDAKEGKLKGIAFAASYRRQEYVVNIAGNIRQNPTLARGMVAYLDDFLSAWPQQR
jgi:hypothetical protein